MHTRRLRPVAALTLALLAAPFLAATAVAAQATPDRAVPARAVTVSWPSTTTSVMKRVTALALKAAESVARPAPQAPPPAARAVPAPPSVDDRSTWLWPANGPVTSGYGKRWGRMHEGVDIDGAYGSPVVAAHRGTVIAAGWGQSGYGLVVHIDHGNGLVTTYNHLSKVMVGSGQLVERGAQIGTLGATGSVTAAHLHYEVRQNGAAVNPAPWLPAGGASAAGNPG